MHERRSLGLVGWIVGTLVATAILAWITYGTPAGVWGMVAYLLVGLLGLFPWLLPYVGIPLGLLDLFDVFGVGMYQVTLHLAHLEPSWLSALWYALVAVLGTVAGLLASIQITRLAQRRRPQARNLALVNGHIIDGKRDSPVIDDGIILIRNVTAEGELPGRIAAVGRAGEVAIPPGYETIDLGGQYVLPGFINAHCHLAASGKPMALFRLVSENEELARKIVGLLQTPLGKRLALGMMAANARNALHAGVTTLRTLGDLAHLDVKLRKQIDKGQIVGPRLLTTGQPILPTGGHGGYVGITADSPTEIRRLVRANLRQEVDWIKILSTGGVMDARRIGEAGQPQMTVKEIETACTLAHRAGVMVATHCESTKGMEEALLGGVDTIEHGARISDGLLPLFKENPKALRGYTALVPTISAVMGLATLPRKTTQISQMSYENAQIVGREMIWGLQRAYEEGIPLGMGTDASVPYVPHYEFWKELRYYVHYTGMTAQDAIFFATKGTAQVLGIADETGSIEEGKSADLQVVAGNPLEEIEHLARVTKVVIRGTLIDEPRVKRIKALDANPITDMLEVDPT